MIEKETVIKDLLYIRNVILSMKFSLNDMNNLACAKMAVEHVEKVINEYSAETESEDVTVNGNDSTSNS